MKINSGYAEVNDTRLYYELSGEGPTVVLIHGFSIDTRMWDDQMDLLTSHFQVLRYDMRGFGRSALPDERAYGPCVDLFELLAFLKIEKAGVIGLSLGGWVALPRVAAPLSSLPSPAPLSSLPSPPLCPFSGGLQ